MQRRTKIIATLGPASDTPEVLEQMIQAGVDLVRINFSHGTVDSHERRIQRVRCCAEKSGRQVGILVDLQGPKVRISRFRNGAVELQHGRRFVIDPRLPSSAGDAEQVGSDYPALSRDVRAGDTLLLDDGRIVLFVEKIEDTRVITSVQVGGRLSDNKGINLKGGGLSVGALTEKDHQDLVHAARLGADYVAISFVRHAEDLAEAYMRLRAAGGTAGVIAKIERTEAVSGIKDIIAACDGVMVARGDLAVEIGDAEVPAIQKRIIHLARSMNKPVITATQMMESMISSTVPTRAEVSDVANAVLDGTDAVMLSAETAVGAHPHKVIEAVARVCLAVEKQPATRTSGHRIEHYFERLDEVIAMSAMYAANHMHIKAVAAISASGTTPLWMSRIRTGIPIYGLSRHSGALGRMTLFRNVYPVPFEMSRLRHDQIVPGVIAELRHRDLVQMDDPVLITKGDHPGVHGGTNSMKIVLVKED